MVSLKSSKFYGYPLNFGKSQSVVPNKFPIILSQLNDPNFPKDWHPDFTKNLRTAPPYFYVRTSKEHVERKPWSSYVGFMVYGPSQNGNPQKMDM